jgi:hypothetical protein
LTIEENLERIANALEAIAGGETLLVEPDGFLKRVTEDKPAKTAKDKKAAAKPAAAKPAAEEEAPAAEETPADADTPVSEDPKDKLRAALHAFQVEHGAKTTKEIMAPFGATIGKIKATDYDELLTALDAHEAK